jgi:hypothetical protein
VLSRFQAFAFTFNLYRCAAAVAAASALANLARVSLPNKEAIVAAHAIPSLVHLLGARDRDRSAGTGGGAGARDGGDGSGVAASAAMLSEQAARCVANLASSPTGRELLRESGAILPLVRLLRQPGGWGGGGGGRGGVGRGGGGGGGGDAACAAATEHAVWALASLANEVGGCTI